MNCNQVRELASGLFDGTIATEERAALERHVVQCGACREELREFHEATRALRERGRAATAAPAGHVAAVLAALPPEDARPRRVAAQLFWALCGAAAVLLVWLTSALLARGPAQAQVPAEVVEVEAVPREVARAVPVVVPILLTRERRVESVREVRMTEADPALRSAALALSRMAYALEALAAAARRSEPVTTHIAEALEAPTPSVTRPEATLLALGAPEPPVHVRREADRLTLSLHGGWPVVVPGLIDLLEDQDPEVAVLAARELELIQNDLTPGVRPRSVQRPVKRPDPLESLLGREDDAREAAAELPPGPAEWRRWWQDHGLAALGAEVL